MLIRFVVVACFAALTVSVSNAQNVVQDYVLNRPHQYSPQDPWQTGVVFRHQAGWGGLFFNCDRQEDKRCSPYIYWSTQPQECRPKNPIVSCIHEQICEVKQRVRWGASCAQPSAAYASSETTPGPTEAEMIPSDEPPQPSDTAPEFIVPDDAAPDVPKQPTPAAPKNTAKPESKNGFKLIKVGNLLNKKPGAFIKETSKLSRAIDKSGDMSFRMTRRPNSSKQRK